MAARSVLGLSGDGVLEGPGTQLASVHVEPSALIANQGSFYMARPYRNWARATSRASFPTLGPEYNAFENEIVSADPSEYAAIITKYIGLFCGKKDGVTDALVARERARLTTFTTDYTTWVSAYE